MLTCQASWQNFWRSLKFRTVDRTMETNSTKESPKAQVCEPHAGEGTTEIYIDPVKEARMMRKFDVREPFLHLVMIN